MYVSGPTKHGPTPIDILVFIMYLVKMQLIGYFIFVWTVSGAFSYLEVLSLGSFCTFFLIY